MEEVPYLSATMNAGRFWSWARRRSANNSLKSIGEAAIPTRNHRSIRSAKSTTRRLAYAGRTFRLGRASRKTDRGRIYIIWGPPDEIEAHPSGGTFDRPLEQGGGTTSTYHGSCGAIGI